jgi:6-phosphogluconolactonase
MKKPSRREFLLTASAATLATAASSPLSAAASGRQRVFVASGAKDGILAYDWNSATGELAPVGVAAPLVSVSWITYSRSHEFLFAAAEGKSYQGKHSGVAASFRVVNGELQPLSEQNSAGAGTCYVALDHTGRVLLAADYSGGSAASFLVSEGKLSPAVWTEHYTVHGPNAERQESAHAHFTSFSPDNRFAYINDLGGDVIHIYGVNQATAMLTAAGSYHARPGAGPRTICWSGTRPTAA